MADPLIAASQVLDASAGWAVKGDWEMVASFDSTATPENWPEAEYGMSLSSSEAQEHQTTASLGMSQALSTEVGVETTVSFESDVAVAGSESEVTAGYTNTESSESSLTASFANSISSAVATSKSLGFTCPLQCPVLVDSVKPKCNGPQTATTHSVGRDCPEGQNRVYLWKWYVDARSFCITFALVSPFPKSLTYIRGDFNHAR